MGRGAREEGETRLLEKKGNLTAQECSLRYGNSGEIIWHSPHACAVSCRSGCCHAGVSAVRIMRFTVGSLYGCSKDNVFSSLHKRPFIKSDVSICERQ
jgi:hypothetical protein